MPVTLQNLAVSTPDYIYRRARDLFRRKRTIDPRGNTGVNLFLSYLYTQESTKGAMRDVNLVEGEYPLVHKAVALRNDLADKRKYVLEAGVFAGATAKELSKALNTPEDVISMYETLFFNIRENLNTEGCFIGNLVPSVLSDREEVDEQDIWKLVGFFGGWEVLKSYLFNTESNTVAARLVVNLIGQKELRKSLTATFSEKVSRSSAPSILERVMAQQVAAMGLVAGKDRAEAASAEVQAVYDMMDKLNIRPMEPAEGDLLTKDEFRRLPEGLPDYVDADFTEDTEEDIK